MVRRSFSVGVTIAALALAISTVQDAQAQGKRGGGGMGMRGARGVNPLMLVGNPAVQKDLGLSEENATKVKEITDDVRQEMQEQIAGSGIDFQGLRDLQGEEREKRMAEIQTKMAEVNKTINDKFLPKINEILDKNQQKRLHEIAIQAAGSAALEDAGVVKDLGLSKDQTDKIKSIVKDFAGKTRAIPRDADRSERMAKMAELREEETAKVTEVLTKDQQAKFTDMKGKPFDTKSLQGGGGRRRRRDNN
jgi:hypothetical protein